MASTIDGPGARARVVRRPVLRWLNRLMVRLVWHPTGLHRPGRVVRGRSGFRELERAVSGRVVVITGASSGIGRATAILLAEVGATVALVARRREELEEVGAEIERSGGTVSVHPADLADLDAIDRLATDVLAQHGAVDVLVNNAGLSIRRTVLESADRFDDFERTIQLNYLGAVRLTTSLLPPMCARGSGTIVHVSTLGTQVRAPRFAAYVASKAAFDAFGDVLAAELRRDGIRFTSVLMPLVRTPMMAPARRAYSAVPMLRADEAAQLIGAAIAQRPRTVRTRLGDLAAVSHALVPKGTLAALAFYDDAAERAARRER